MTTTSPNHNQPGPERTPLRTELEADLKDAYPAVHGYIRKRVTDEQTAEKSL